VKVEIPQIPSTNDTSLFESSYASNQSDRSFQQTLEEEKKRLGATFSPLAGFNFNGLFSYPNLSDKINRQLEVFSDTNQSVYQYQENKKEPTWTNTSTTNQTQTATQQGISQLTNNNSNTATKVFLQQLLNKAGWLTPNLEAQPLLQQMQMQGKILNKIDLQFLVDQILSQVKLVKEKGQLTLLLSLKPENLGEIILSLTARSGMVSIQIQAEEKTKELLEDEMRELEIALKKAKVNLSEIKIISIKEVSKHV